VIAGRLRGGSCGGELSAGSRLSPEAELQAQLGVSRPTLRKAFRILEAAGATLGAKTLDLYGGASFTGQ